MQGLETDSASIAQSMHRTEVITGEAIRRSYSDGFKGWLVALTLVPDACIADIAKAHSNHPQLLYTWPRQAKAGKLALPAADMPDFAPVVSEEEAPPSALPTSSSNAGIEIVIDGVTARLPSDADAVRIVGIAAALRQALSSPIAPRDRERVSLSRKFVQDVKVYSSTMRGIRHGEATPVHG